MKKIVLLTLFVALVTLHSPAKALASGYVGGGAGLLELSGGGITGSTLAESIFAGYKFGGALGLGAFYQFKTGYSNMGGSVDFYPGGKMFYIGPRVGETTLVIISGLNYGAGAGVNIPVGQALSLGVDASYMTGSLSVLGVSVGTISAINVAANLKFWM